VPHIARGDFQAELECGCRYHQIRGGQSRKASAQIASDLTCPTADCFVHGNPSHDPEKPFRPASFGASDSPKDFDTGDLGAGGDGVQTAGIANRFPPAPQHVDDY
jgi:hypothetical protein